MPIVLAKLPGGRELHALHEEQPICFRMPAPRRTREAQAIDDFGAVTAERRNSPVRHYPHDPLALLAAEGVPIHGLTEGASIGSAMIGVEFAPRTHHSAADLTHTLKEAGVPLAPPPKRRRAAEEDMSFADWHGEDEGAEEEGEDETRTDEDESLRLREDEDDDFAWEKFIEEVGQTTADAAKGLQLLAAAIRRQRRSALAAGGGLG